LGAQSDEAVANHSTLVSEKCSPIENLSNDTTFTLFKFCHFGNPPAPVKELLSEGGGQNIASKLWPANGQIKIQKNSSE
jgi:hypothetical protein